MSILIKGMEMPTRCGECLLAKLSPTGESLICDYMLSRVSWEERPFDCPLIPVPPHGRCVDADVLCKVLQKDSEHEWNNKTAPFSWAYAYDCVRDTVENMPTVIPAEEGET